MAYPDYFKSEFGTAIVWGQASGSGVTKTLSFNALAAGSGQMGAKADLGAQWDEEHVAILMAESGSAPTAGMALDGYLAYSYDDTTWPAGVSGSDGAWPADGNEDEWAKQLGRPVISLISTNDGNTTQVQNAVCFRPKSRYIAPVVDNNWDQALRNQGTPANNTSRFIIIPKRFLIQDTA
jgi:hypothetical protein